MEGENSAPPAKTGFKGAYIVENHSMVSGFMALAEPKIQGH